MSQCTFYAIFKLNLQIDENNLAMTYKMNKLQNNLPFGNFLFV